MELTALIQMGIFKDLNAMNDREMFFEYDKMLKQSTKIRKQYKDRLKLKQAKLQEDLKKYSINGKNEFEEQEQEETSWDNSNEIQAKSFENNTHIKQ